MPTYVYATWRGGAGGERRARQARNLAHPTLTIQLTMRLRTSVCAECGTPRGCRFSEKQHACRAVMKMHSLVADVALGGGQIQHEKFRDSSCPALNRQSVGA